MSKPILCIGLTPALERNVVLSSLSAGDVNRAKRVTRTYGGKGVNVAVALACLGAEPILTGLLGEPVGELVDDLLEAKGIRRDWVHVPQDTRICTNLIDEETGQVTVLVEEAEAPPPETWDLFEQRMEGWHSQVGGVVLSGGLPDTFPVAIYHDLILLMDQQGLFTIVDTQGPPLHQALLARPTVAKLNDRELQRSVNLSSTSEEDLAAGTAELHAMGANWVLVTKGPEPALLRGPNSLHRLIPPTVQEVHPVGSGDATSAGIAYQLSRGAAMLDAVRFGMACGAASATVMEPARVSPDLAHRLTADIRTEAL